MKKILATILALTMVMMLVACGGSSAPAASNAPAASAPAAGEKYRMTIGTGGSGGVFYVLGAAMGNVMTEKSEIMNLTAQATTATTENLNGIQDGTFDFAFTLFDVAHCAYTGTREYESIGKLDNLRIVCLGHVGLNTYLVFEQSPIKTFADADPSKYILSMGSGFTGYLLANAAVEGWGYELDTARHPILSYVEAATALKDGTIDVMQYHGAHPASAVYDAASAYPIRILSHTEESLAKILAKYPYWVPGTIPGGIYDGVDEDVLTFGTPYAIVCHKDTPDEVVEDYLNILFETDWTPYHQAGEYYTPDNQFYQDLYAQNDADMIPFHPAAKAYLENLGVGDLSSGI